MANQDLCLESLFHYVVKHKTLKLNKITQHFDTSSKEVLQKLKGLTVMGLPLNISSKSIELSQLISPLDIAYIQSKSQRQVFYFFSTNSTNTHAKNSDKDAIFITEHQTSGRGQHGKSWLTPLGQSIALSLSYSLELPLANLSGLNIAIGVAVIKVIAKFSSQRISLKWPNDIIGSSGKIAGILIEAHGNKSQCTACIGIGINWNVAPRLLALVNQPCMNVDIDATRRSQFIASLINELYKVIEEFKTNKLKNIIKEWNKFDLFNNKAIHITEATKSYDATYLEVDFNGILRVRVGEKIKLIPSASIRIL